MLLSKGSCRFGLLIMIFTLPVIFPMTSYAQLPPFGSPLLAAGGSLPAGAAFSSPYAGAFSPYGLGINPISAQYFGFGGSAYQSPYSYGQNPYGRQYAYGQNPYGQYAYGQPPYAQNPYGQPYGQYAYGQNPYGQPYGQYAYGQNPYGQYAYGQTPYGQYGYAHPPYGQPYGQYAYGQNPYGQYAYGQTPYAQNPYGQYAYASYSYGQSPYYAQNPYSQSAGTQQLKTADKSLTENDNGDQVTLSEDKTLSVVLAANQSTGYQWMLDTVELDTDVVEKVSSQYYLISSANGIGTVQQWIFKAKGPGTTTIRLKYVNSSGTVNKIFEITVEVED
ncbi:MAG: protease inhibitor I42 family protein [bacterium]|nr:protease inhibitor I42 family protein [bacterium]